MVVTIRLIVAEIHAFRTNCKNRKSQFSPTLTRITQDEREVKAVPEMRTSNTGESIAQTCTSSRNVSRDLNDRSSQQPVDAVSYPPSNVAQDRYDAGLYSEQLL